MDNPNVEKLNWILELEKQLETHTKICESIKQQIEGLKNSED